MLIVSHGLHFSFELLAILGDNLCLLSAHLRPFHSLGDEGPLLMLDLTLLITVHAPFGAAFHHLHLARLALQLFALADVSRHGHVLRSSCTYVKNVNGIGHHSKLLLVIGLRMVHSF